MTKRERKRGPRCPRCQRSLKPAHPDEPNAYGVYLGDLYLGEPLGCTNCDALYVWDGAMQWAIQYDPVRSQDIEVRYVIKSSQGGIMFIPHIAVTGRKVDDRVQYDFRIDVRRKPVTTLEGEIL